MISEAEQRIRELHQLYCDRTGHEEIEFNDLRLRQWHEWLHFRKQRPFTADDLIRVIGHIRQGIHKGERNEGALKFTNLIGNPDKFEEDLSLAMGAMKARQAADKFRGNAIPIIPPPIEDRATPEEFAAMLKKPPH